MNGEGRPLSHLAFDEQPSAVTVHDVLDNGQTKTGSTDRAAAPDIHAVEALSKPRNMLAGNAFPTILYRQVDSR